MRINIPPIVLVWIGIGMLSLWGIQGKAQDKLTFEESQTIFGQQPIMKFRKFSLELTDESKRELMKLAGVIAKVPAMIHHNVIVIQVFTCEQEIRVKPYIGACRGQVIVDYFEEVLNLSRKKCLILDSGRNAFDTDCLAGSGVNLYLKPEWTE